MSNGLLNIFLVEDDEVDVMNVKRAFAQNNIRNPLFIAHDGVEALENLRSGEIPNERRVVLLDLNMPRMNGIEFLREVRNDPLRLRMRKAEITSNSSNALRAR
jgi:CheY-like chemotaxis protein